MAERRAGSDAAVALRIGAGDWVDHDSRAARAQLRTAFAAGRTDRPLPSGVTVRIATGWRDGRVSWQMLRTRDIDRQLTAAHQARGDLRWRPLGPGSGLPQRIVPVTVQASLTVAAGALASWTVTLMAAGPVDDTAQT